MTARRSERTRVIADLAWLGGMVEIALGTALLAVSEAPLIAATLAIVSGAVMLVAGTLVMFGMRGSWSAATVAFALSLGAAAYSAWVAAPYWRGSVIVGALALGGLVAGWTRQHRPAPAESGAS